MVPIKTYPVPNWVRTVVCLAPFVISLLAVLVWWRTGWGFPLLGSSLVLCGVIAKHALTKS